MDQGDDFVFAGALAHGFFDGSPLVFRQIDQQAHLSARQAEAAGKLVALFTQIVQCFARFSKYPIALVEYNPAELFDILRRAHIPVWQLNRYVSVSFAFRDFVKQMNIRRGAHFHVPLIDLPRADELTQPIHLGTDFRLVSDGLLPHHHERLLGTCLASRVKNLHVRRGNRFTSLCHIKPQ
ncbi:MAG TPA: hypothetical protein PLR02_07340 [Rhodocyclaceae bacterium]|nr:hypothetical protein [Rhodocyclaceae bacterium]